MPELHEVFDDLAAECAEIDKMVVGLDAAGWATPTPAPGWTVAHQIAHLTFIFELARTAAADPGAFQKMIEGAENDFNGAVNRAVEAYLDAPAALLKRWQTAHAGAVEALAAVPADQTVPWLVRPLPAAILACAGIMESFGHGQDIADALSVRRDYTDRLEHLVGFSVVVWDFAYLSRGLTPPDTQFRFEITLPSGRRWDFGPEDAENRVSGPAVDFCLLTTRRRHRADLAVRATGADADSWLDIAQAYRGPAGEGRRPGQFAHEGRTAG